jgi:hypothetical protein
VAHLALGDKSNMYFPQMHIQLGVIKASVKSIDKKRTVGPIKAKISQNK